MLRYKSVPHDGRLPMTKSGFRKDALRAFVNADEGAPPPVFVGRRNVMEDIEGRAGVAWKGQGATEHGSPKATRVIQGAPVPGRVPFWRS